MPETTPLIKAALNLQVGAGFDVYYEGVSKAVCFAMKASTAEDMEVCLNDSGWEVPIEADYLTRSKPNYHQRSELKKKLH